VQEPEQNEHAQGSNQNTHLKRENLMDEEQRTGKGKKTGPQKQKIKLHRKDGRKGELSG